MSTRQLISAFPIALCMVPFATTYAAQPNVIVILADDLGYGDVHCYNPERCKIPTPHLDRLAAQGMRFTDGHSSSGVCSPSRYTLLTGRYHWRTQLQSGVVGMFGEPLIAPDRMTIGTLARQHGYRTACIGKWHLGWDWPIAPEQRKFFHDAGKKGKNDEAAVPADARLAAWRDVFSKPIAGGPTTRGFDAYFGTDVPNWPPFCFIENDRTVGIPNESRGGNPALQGWTFEPILPTLGERAAQFITAQATQGAPFLLYLPLTSPHAPIAPTSEWQGKSGINKYADFVMETDAVVGQVLDALEKSGAAANTLVLFTSDNGCAPYIGVEEMEAKGHYPSGPLRGYKGSVWEGGHREPFIVRWPGVVKPGSVCGQLVHQADLMRTMADIWGAQLPDNAGEDSFSILPLLKGVDKPIRQHAVSCSVSGVPALRDGSWKLIAATTGNGRWDKDASAIKPATPVLLYNLDDDIGETKNLAADQPERVAQMRALMEQLIVDGRSTPGVKQKNDVEVRRFATRDDTKRRKE